MVDLDTASAQALQEIKEFLQKTNKRVSTAESCTSGILASLLTSIPGSSTYFSHGFVTYSNEAKSDIGVSDYLINKYTCYSSQVAKSMAKAASMKGCSKYGIGVTGVLGPAAEGNVSPGTVWIGMYDMCRLKSKRLKLTGAALSLRMEDMKDFSPRLVMREEAARYALIEFAKFIKP